MNKLKQISIIIFGVVFLSLSLAPPAAAAPYQSASLDKTVKVYLRGIWLQSCMKQEGTILLSDDRVRSYEWFNSNDGNAVGVYIDPDDGRTDCKESASVKNALDELGFKTDDPVAVANQLHIKSGTNTNMDSSDVMDRVFQPFFSGTQKNGTKLLQGAPFYLLNYQSFKAKCDPKFVVDKAKANQTQLADLKSGKSVVVNEYDDSGKKIESIYTFTSSDTRDSGNTKVGPITQSRKVVRNEDPSRYVVIESSCADLISNINSGAGTAYANYKRSHKSEKLPGPGNASPASQSGDSKGESEDKSTCQVDQIGWILCPVLNVGAKIVDNSYDVVSNMLKVNAFTTSNASLKNAWTSFKNLANVAFVIAFIFIIYSQLTGYGLSNYGIKKMLPRLIVVAVLVNISYWICALAVDISNIAGSGMKTFIDGGQGLNFKDAAKTNDFATGSGWEGIAGGILAATTIGVSFLYIGISALIPALVAALIVIVTVMLALTLRQALIIILIVVSPLAFIAYLLPNTEQWFKRWRDLFQALLIMYPIVGIIFGASSLASKIIMASASDVTTSGTADNKAVSIAVQVMGALVSILPLVLVPMIMKSSHSLIGRFMGAINNPNRGPFDRMRNGAKSFRENSVTNMNARRLTRWSNRKNNTGLRKAGAYVSGGPMAIGMEMRARRDRSNARLEAAEAGFTMDSDAAREASQYRMAASAAKSAQSSAALSKLDENAQREAVGTSEGENHYFEAALRSQVSASQRQAIQDVEAQIAPQSAGQLAKTLADAIKEGEVVTALAAQNTLSQMGNKGVDTLQSVIGDREGKGDNKNWDVMRLELARNLGGGVMDKNEVLKQWATGTEFAEGKLQTNYNDTGKQTNNLSIKDITSKVVASGGASDMSLEKFAKQTPTMQKNMIDKGAISTDVMKNMLTEKNRGAFDQSTLEIAEKKLGSTLSPAASTQPYNSSNGATLNIPHGGSNSTSILAGSTTPPQGSSLTTQKTPNQTIPTAPSPTEAPARTTSNTTINNISTKNEMNRYDTTNINNAIDKSTSVTNGVTPNASPQRSSTTRENDFESHRNVDSSRNTDER